MEPAKAQGEARPLPLSQAEMVPITCCRDLDVTWILSITGTSVYTVPNLETSGYLELCRHVLL